LIKLILLFNLLSKQTSSTNQEMKREQAVQASRLIPRHTFADIGIPAPQKGKK